MPNHQEEAILEVKGLTLRRDDGTGSAIFSVSYCLSLSGPPKRGGGHDEATFVDQVSFFFFAFLRGGGGGLFVLPALLTLSYLTPTAFARPPAFLGCPLQNVNLTVHAGDVLILRGRSGSGKTSLLKCLAELNVYHAGRILLRGKTASELEVPTYRTRVLYVPQRPSMLPGTPRDFLDQVLSFAARRAERSEADKSKGDEARARCRQLANEWGLEPVMWQRDWATLSGGEAQRMALAIAAGIGRAEIVSPGGAGTFDWTSGGKKLIHLHPLPARPQSLRCLPGDGVSDLRRRTDKRARQRKHATSRAVVAGHVARWRQGESEGSAPWRGSSRLVSVERISREGGWGKGADARPPPPAFFSFARRRRPLLPCAPSLALSQPPCHAAAPAAKRHAPSARMDHA